MARRAMRSDWGSVTEIDRGKRYRLRWWQETPEGYKRCSEVVRGTRRDACDRLAEIRLEHSRDAPCPTVGELWESRLVPDCEARVAAGDLAPASLEQYRSTWRRHVRDRWADVPADQVTPLEVQRWLLGMPRAAAVAALPRLRRALDYAVLYGYLDANPCAARYMMPARSTSARRDDGTWDEAGLGDVWHACWGSWVEPAVILMGFGGCRVGESLAVRAESVSLVKGGSGVPIALVGISGQVDSHGRLASRTKTPESARTCAVPGAPARRLAALAAATGSGLMVEDGTGRNAGQQQARECFTRLLADAGVDAHPMKQLRKSWQTIARWRLMLEPIYTEPMMGHRLPGTTGHYYDRPDGAVFASVLGEAYARRPFADSYGWLRGAL